MPQGDWMPGHMVVVEFGSMEQEWAWYDSPEVDSPRQALANSGNSIIFVESV